MDSVGTRERIFKKISRCRLSMDPVTICVTFPSTDSSYSVFVVVFVFLQSEVEEENEIYILKTRGYFCQHASKRFSPKSEVFYGDI